MIPQPFNRTSFITLNSNRLFTAKEVANLIKEYTSRPAPSAPTDNGFNEQKFRDELSQYLYRYVDIPSAIQREVFERDIISCARGCVYPVPIDTVTTRNQTLDEVRHMIEYNDDLFQYLGNEILRSKVVAYEFLLSDEGIKSLRREVQP